MIVEYRNRYEEDNDEYNHADVYSMKLGVMVEPSYKTITQEAVCQNGLEKYNASNKNIDLYSVFQHNPSIDISDNKMENNPMFYTSKV